MIESERNFSRRVRVGRKKRGGGGGGGGERETGVFLYLLIHVHVGYIHLVVLYSVFYM